MMFVLLFLLAVVNGRFVVMLLIFDSLSAFNSRVSKEDLRNLANFLQTSAVLLTDLCHRAPMSNHPIPRRLQLWTSRSTAMESRGAIGELPNDRGERVLLVKSPASDLAAD